MISRKLQILTGVLLVAVFGLGFYTVRLKHVAERPQPIQDTRPVAPPVAGPMVGIVLYVAVDDDGLLHKRDVSIPLPDEPSKRAREILRALIAQYEGKASPHPLGPGADINEVYFVNGSLAVIDTNAAFADSHRSGILVEELTLASMARTLSANFPAVTRMKVLVEGKERDTLAGHADIKGLYELSAVSRLAKEEQ